MQSILEYTNENRPNHTGFMLILCLDQIFVIDARLSHLFLTLMWENSTSNSNPLFFTNEYIFYHTRIE